MLFYYTTVRLLLLSMDHITHRYDTYDKKITSGCTLVVVRNRLEVKTVYCTPVVITLISSNQVCLNQAKLDLFWPFSFSLLRHTRRARLHIDIYV